MSSGPDSPQPAASTSAGPVNKHAPTAVERQRLQLDRLLKDPAKPAHIPKAPTEKTLRAPREMMKNVQGSSAGAGSGEFHVYKQNRRREYERLKLMDENSKREVETAEFEARKRDREELADAKTAKNRAKRQKRKQARGGKKKNGSDDSADEDGDQPSNTGKGTSSAPFKKRRILGGGATDVTFRRPGEDDSDEGDIGPAPPTEVEAAVAVPEEPVVAVVDTPAIIIHDDD